MVNYLLGTLGIVVSVASFLIVYRQTIGARRERVASANADLSRILLRRVVLESFSPTHEEIDRLRDGKSREYRVATSNILMPVELMNVVYTQVVENDFISPDLRKEIVGRISPLFEKLNKAEEQEPEPAKGAFFVPALLAISSSALGAAIAVLPRFRSTALGSKSAIELVVFTGGASFAIIVTFLLFKRLRDEQEETPPRNTMLRSALEFESAVASTIRKIGLPVVRAPIQSGYDFQVVTKTGTKVLVETKAWAGRVPISLVLSVVGRLSGLVAKEGAKEALLVVRRPLDLPTGIVGDAPVRILSLREMRNYFAH
jgi:hypothetical protein